MCESKKINAWVAVDADGSECIFREEPYRREGGVWFSSSLSNKFVELPKGSIKALIGRELSWNGEPVELKEPVSPCIDCECAKFADKIIKPSEMLRLHNTLKEIKE